MLARLADLMPNSVFVRNIGVLAGGTVFAQALMALSLPVLTRLYTPEDFSLLAVYMAILGLITVISCLRFNIAIPLPERDEDAMNLVALSLISAAATSVILVLPVIVAPDFAATALGQPDMARYLWLVPLGVLLASVYAALQYWASRRKRFKLVAATHITRAIGGTGSQLTLGLVQPTPFGLILGHMIYGGLGVVGLGRAMWRKDRNLFHAITPSAMRANLREYRRFPLYSVPEALFNTGGVQIPILLLAALAAGPEAGFLMLAMRVMGLPMGLLGRSISQVYLAEAPQKLREGVLAPFTRRVMVTLFKIGGPPLVAVGLLSPFAFPIVFGEEWARAGVVVAWLTPWFLLQFVSSPISIVLHVTGHLGQAMALQAFGLVFRVGAVLCAAWYVDAWIIEAFAISSMVFYGMYIIIINIYLNKGGVCK